MADVTQSVGLFEQIRLVAGLRWRLLRNSMRKKNNRLDLIGLIFAAIFGGILVIGLCFAFYAGAYQFLSYNRPAWIALLFWAIFLFWQVIPLFVAGFGANFEFRSLLRFPMSLSAFYIIGLAYGLADVSAIASLCWLLSMTAGAAVAKPGVLPAMLLIGAAFVLFNVTLERLIGSWLERLLSRRRTREIFLGLFVLSMISLNFITPLANRYGAAARPAFLRLLPYFAWLPPSLAGRAIASVAQLQPAGFLLSAAGLLFMSLSSALCCEADSRRSIAVKNSARRRPRPSPPSVQSRRKTTAPIASVCFHPRSPPSFAKSSATLRATVSRSSRCCFRRCWSSSLV